MSGLCGWVDFAPERALEAGLIGRMAEPLVRFDNGRVEYLPGDFGALALGLPRDDVHPGPRGFAGKEGVALVHGSPWFADPVLAEEARTAGLAATLLRLYARRGAEALGLLHGPFAVALVLPERREACAAVDRLGICPLTYAHERGCVVFGSRGACVNAHPRVARVLDPQALYDYLYFHVVPAPQTAYRDQHRLLPGQYLLLSGERLEIGQYWQIEYTRETERVRPEILKQEFRDLLARGVARAADSAGMVGAFLSGGTDSSTVAGMLGRHAGRPARTYSIGFDAQGYDEMQYARIAARHFGTEHHEYYLTPEDVVRAAPDIAACYDVPFGNSSAVGVYYCARMARADGVSHLLAGDGGDELFGGNARYAKQYIFSLYQRIPTALRARLVEPLLLSPTGIGRVPLLHKARRYVEQARVPLPARLETYNLLERLGVERVLQDPFLQSIDRSAPLAHLEAVYRDAGARTALNRMLAVDLKITLADNDLPKVSRMCELAGIEARYPLLDDELLAFSARLPVDLKLRRTRMRYFFKEALADFLPPEIIAKTKHGFGLPVGPWLLRHPRLHELARESLHGLAVRGIVRRAFIDALFERHLPEHPGYYGTMAWVLLMLALWFEQQSATNAGAKGSGARALRAP